MGRTEEDDALDLVHQCLEDMKSEGVGDRIDVLEGMGRVFASAAEIIAAVVTNHRHENRLH